MTRILRQPLWTSGQRVAVDLLWEPRDVWTGLGALWYNGKRYHGRRDAANIRRPGTRKGIFRMQPESITDHCGALSVSGLYQITHAASGRAYIGSAVNVQRRWREHRTHLKRGDHRNPKLQAAWTKHGSAAFTFALLEAVTDRADLVVREQCYLDTVQPWFNIALSASNPMLGRRQSEKFLDMLHGRKGRVVPEAMRERIAATLRGRPGQPKSIEWRRRIADKLKGHAVSDETRAKISAKGRGYRHTDDAKRRIGAASTVNVTRIMRAKSRFTADDILRIRELRASGMTCKEIASLYGVTRQTISKIALGRRWADVVVPDVCLVAANRP